MVDFGDNLPDVRISRGDRAEYDIMISIPANEFYAILKCIRAGRVKAQGKTDEEKVLCFCLQAVRLTLQQLGRMAIEQAKLLG